VSIEKSDPRLTAYVFGELSAAEVAALEAELAADESARAELAEIQRTVAALRSELSAAPPPALAEERRARIEQTARKLREKAPSRAGRRLLWGLASAGSVAALGLLFLTNTRSERPAQSRAALPLASAYSAPVATLAPEVPDSTLVKPSSALVATPSAAVRAGEWDDNANYREFSQWLGGRPAPAAHYMDIRQRRFVVVRDAAGMGVPACRIVVEDDQDLRVDLWTSAAGRALLFPYAEGLAGRELTATTRCAGGAKLRFSLNEPDGVVELRVPEQRVLPQERSIDVAFILDSTGSMSEEIAAVKSTIQKVAESLRGSNVRVRMGLVEFKDRGDPFVTKIYPMSTELRSFAQQVAEIHASGGGDTPESVNEALHVAVQQLAWNDASIAKLAFLVGDAPPHLDYPQDYHYALEARTAAQRGIQIFTVAASGMDTLGQVVWRQVAQYTGATNLFVLRGGAGPQSTGAGDPKSSCGGTQTAYTSGNLDALILAKINGTVRSLERDPLLIPGLHTDENAKPCTDRVLAQ
jgi:uncharacterized protein YegL